MTINKKIKGLEVWVTVEPYYLALEGKGYQATGDWVAAFRIDAHEPSLIVGEYVRSESGGPMFFRNELDAMEAGFQAAETRIGG